MPIETMIQGFSRFSREEKIRIASEFALHPVEFAREMIANWLPGRKTGEQDRGFTENAVSDFRLPYSVAPNFLVNGKQYMVPMVTEESSVIAAASSAAKFWWDRGGFVTTTGNLIKPGQIHFIWKGTEAIITNFVREIREGLLDSVSHIVRSMKSRGGGIDGIQLKNLTDKLEGYYQIEVLFNTVDAMGANFINTCLETMSEFMLKQAEKRGISESLEIIMSVLSNYTPQCLVKCMVACKISDLVPAGTNYRGSDFSRRFETAVQMAHHDISRAVTHNKGIFNGVDAVVMATGNDFRAVEAAGHSWACKDGVYKALSEVRIQGNEFEFSLEIPLAIGVVGGLTNLHPMARASLQLLGDPNAKTLMSVAASAGMANHFSAIRALTTGGIQRGHMKLHLVNILGQLKADEVEKNAAIMYFRNHKISFNSVRDFLVLLRER